MTPPSAATPPTSRPPSDGKASSPVLDIAFVRAQFPALCEGETAAVAFFENAGGSYPCRQTIARLHDFYLHCKVQPYATFAASREAGRRMDEAVARLKALLNVPDTHELVVGPSTSQHAHVLACAFTGLLKPGDEIVVTDQDHEANSGFWRRLAEHGVVVREWRLDPESGRLEVSALERLLDARTRFVAFPHCSNIIGHFNDAPTIVRRIREAGAWAVVDGVSAAPHGLPDIATIDADVYFFSAYKTWGPHQGVMAIRRTLLFELPTQGHWFNEADPAKRLVPAGPDHAQVAALAGIVDYVETLHAHHFADEEKPTSARINTRVAGMFRRREIELLAPLLSWLSEQTSRLRLLGPGVDDAAERAPTVALCPSRLTPEEAAARLAERGIWVGAGHFYAVRTLKALGVDPAHGVLRISFLHYNHADEIDRLIAALDAVL